LPHRYAGSWPRRVRDNAYPELAESFRAAEPALLALLETMERHAPALRAIGDAPPSAPRWRQSWFPRLDAAAAYVLLRERRPRRLVEVGSGHSTRFFRRAAQDGDFALAITAIDPAPRADIAALPITLHRRLLQELVLAPGPGPFDGLGAGDVVSLDSSHLLVPGSDVDLFFGRVLPRLPLGCLLQIHDIFLPDDYPPAWDWRGYNEQQVLPPLLQGGGWRILWSSRWAATRLSERVAKGVAGSLPLMPGALETSLWLERVR
ncbi:MAG: class I SAM-dependent methyltransferase, partial [Tistlia sp.]